jgi:hypothetical protein
MDSKRTPGGMSAEGSRFMTGASNNGSYSGGSKVMDWISLFQDSGECMQMESNELTQYSCTTLLREMEAAANSDSDMDEVGLGGGGDKDDELVHLPELCW